MKRRIRKLARQLGSVIEKYVPDVVAARAKAIAAFLAPYVAAAVLWVLDQVGVNVDVDVSFVQLLLFSLLSGGVVERTRNRR